MAYQGVSLKWCWLVVRCETVSLETLFFSWIRRAVTLYDVAAAVWKVRFVTC